MNPSNELYDVINACKNFPVSELSTLPVFSRKGKPIPRNVDRLLKVLTARINPEVFEGKQLCLRLLLYNTAGCLPYVVRIIEHAARISRRRGKSTIEFDVIRSATNELTQNILDRLSGGDYAFLFLLGSQGCRAVAAKYPEKLAEMVQSGALLQYSKRSVRVLPLIVDFISEHPEVLTWSEAEPYAPYLAKYQIAKPSTEEV